MASKLTILVLAVIALLGPAAVSVLAHKLKRPWTDPQIDAVGVAVRWGAIGAIVLLVLETLWG